MNSPEGQALFSIPSYKPSDIAAFGVASLYYVLGVVLLVEGFISRRYRYAFYTVLTSWLLGVAFTARGRVFAESVWDDGQYLASSILENVAPNIISLVNFLLLIDLMHGLGKGPPRIMLKIIWVFSVTTLVAFGVMSTAGLVILSRSSTWDPDLTGINLVLASIAGQMVTNLLFIVLAIVLMMWYTEALSKRAWVIVIYVSGLLVVARSSARIAAAFYISSKVTRSTEAAYYCLGPLFTLAIISMWAAMNLPARCQHEAESLWDGQVDAELDSSNAK
ncbi:hypothetical protein IWW57_002313 [Coemansia sp. S610]|nr:hypothetical protein IWW57_002313 [Coemansia sp. S610]